MQAVLSPTFLTTWQKRSRSMLSLQRSHILYAAVNCPARLHRDAGITGLIYRSVQSASTDIWSRTSTKSRAFISAPRYGSGSIVAASPVRWAARNGILRGIVDYEKINGFEGIWTPRCPKYYLHLCSWISGSVQTHNHLHPPKLFVILKILS